MDEHTDLFDIVESDFQWVSGRIARKTPGLENPTLCNEADIEEDKKMEKSHVVKSNADRLKTESGIPDKRASFTGPRACFSLFPAPEHEYFDCQLVELDGDSTLTSVPEAVYKNVDDGERPARRVVFDCMEPAPSRKGLPGPNVDFVTGKPLPYYVPYSSEDKTAVFESRFESGNLKRATQIGPNEYELLLKPDLNTSSYMQWFYFSVSNLPKGICVRLNIVNMYKSNSLYMYGMRPLMYSRVRSAIHKIGWVRCGRNIKYFETANLCHEGLFTLSFEFQVPEAEDTLYFAHCFPFTWSFQQKHLTQIIEAHQGKGIIKRDLLCESLHGNRCDYLTITDFELEQVSGSDTSLRPCIFLTARVHPGETNSSWIMKGIIDHLLSDTDVAKALRARFFFVIVPMLNPDGVINGNYRCNLAGFDLNRNWKNPDPNKHRPIFATKQLIQSIQQHRKILFFCDFHGHSAKHNVFMYGCECGNGPQKLIEMVFPCIMSRIAGVFSFSGSSFKMKKDKESTARVVLRRQFDVTHSFTLEASFFGCDFGPHCGEHFSVDHFLAIGRRFLDGILLWSNPDNIWTSASLEYLKNLFAEKEPDATRDPEKNPPVAAALQITKIASGNSTPLQKGYQQNTTAASAKSFQSRALLPRPIMRQPITCDPKAVVCDSRAARLPISIGQKK